MSVASAIWKSDRHCRENHLLGKERRAGQRYYKGFAFAHIETPPFIFGKVDVSRSTMHCQNGWRLAPHKESKAPRLQLSSDRQRSLRRCQRGVGSGGMPVFVSPEECGGMMEGGSPPAPLSHPWTLSRPSKACHWLGMIDTENVLASMKGAECKEM